MPLDKASIRESAALRSSQGKWDKALEDYRTLSKLEPKDLRLRLKIGECLGKLGKKSEAIDAYKEVAARYARDGFLLQAIAVNKLILAIDPSQEYVQKELARLYAKKGLIVDESLLQKEVKDIKRRKMKELPRIPLFSELTESEFVSVIQKMKPRRYPPDSVIVLEGGEGDSIFIITEGEVDVYKKDRKGKQVWLNVLREGDFFGEFGFFSESRRKATVKAKTEVEVQELSKDDLEDIARTYPRVSKVLVEFYKARVLDSILALSPLFRFLSPQQRDFLLDKFELKVVPKGEVIIREGEIGDSLYIIKSGEVEVSRSDEKAGKVVLAHLREGDFFGEVSVITGKPRTATVQTIRPTRLMRLSKKDFDDAAAEAPGVLRSARWYSFVRQYKTLMALLAWRVSPFLGSLLKGAWGLLPASVKGRSAKKALVIEDDAGKRGVLEKYLTSRGYEVTTAESGEQGVKEASRAQPDVILLDPLLPRAEGMEALRRLESAPGVKKPPIVLMDKGSLTDALSPPEPAAGEEEDLLKNIFLPGSVLEDLDSLTAEEEVELVPIEDVGGREGNLKELSFPRLLHSLHRDHFTGTADIRAAQGEKRIHFLEGHPVFVEFGSFSENLGDLLLRKGEISQETYLKSVEEMARTGKKQGEVLVEMGVLTPEGLQRALEDQVAEKLFNCFPLTEGTYRIKEGKEHLTHIFLKKVNTDQVIMEGIKRSFIPERLRDELEPMRNHTIAMADDFTERLSYFGRSLREGEIGDLVPLLSQGITLDEVVARSPLDMERTLQILCAFIATEMLITRPPSEEKEFRVPSVEVHDLYENWEKWKLL